MYEDRTQNYDTEIHEEYLIGLHETRTIPLPHYPFHVQTMA